MIRASKDLSTNHTNHTNKVASQHGASTKVAASPQGVRAFRVFRGSNSKGRRRNAALSENQIPASFSHSTILALGMAPTFIEAIWPSLNSIMVGMPRTP